MTALDPPDQTLPTVRSSAYRKRPQADEEVRQARKGQDIERESSGPELNKRGR